jgi:hypothetical protein
MKLPIWLYHRREDKYGGRTRRWGSARPLRVCVTCIDEPGRPKTDRMKTSWLGCLGRLHFSWGPAEGVAEGHGGLPKGTRERIWWLDSGMAIGLALTPRSPA